MTNTSRRFSLERLTRTAVPGWWPRRLPRRRDETAVLERLEERKLPAVNILQNFALINDNQTSCNCQPPDTIAAIGPDKVLGAVNTALVIKDKAGNVLAAPTEFQTFFSSVYQSGDLFSDPYVAYDDLAQRFYVAILEF